MPRLCPDHRIELEAREFRGVTIDVCPKCGGVFFDEGEVNRVRLDGNDGLSEIDEAVRPSEDYSVDDERPSGANRFCPNCQRKMDRIKYMYSSPVTIDSCGNCGGVWVEDGELTEMQKVLDSAASAKVRAQAHSADERPVDVSRVRILDRVTRYMGRR